VGFVPEGICIEIEVSQPIIHIQPTLGPRFHKYTEVIMQGIVQAIDHQFDEMEQQEGTPPSRPKYIHPMFLEFRRFILGSHIIGSANFNEGLGQCTKSPKSQKPQGLLMSAGKRGSMK
jgi:hypothetical protein